MKKNIQYISTLLLGALLIFTGCDEEKYELGTLKVPGNVDLSYVIVGQDDENLYGDGSGVVNFSASANDEITFNYLFGDGKDSEIAADGNVSHVFAKTGVNTYNVTVIAIGTGGISSSKTIQIEVLSTFTDDEAAEFLTGGSSKTWYWAADQPGHIALGPNFEDAGKAYGAWFSAAPFEKSCMYDAEFVFTKTAEGLTFEQTTGSAYIPGTYAGKIGVDGDLCYGEDVVTTMFGVKSVSFGPASSVATIDGGYRGTSFSLSDGGFMSWYVGASTYEIIQVTENLLKVRVEEDGTYAWYQTFTTVKPIQ